MGIKDDIVQSLIPPAAAFIAVGSKYYTGPLEDLVKGYGLDISFPFLFYYTVKAYGALLELNPKPSLIALSGFIGCSLFEVAQGLGLYESTYDPKDFVAYAIGTSTAITLDFLMFKWKSIDFA